MPVAYVPHGGGPWPFVDFGLPRNELEAMTGYLRRVPGLPSAPPRALLVVSAHWEEPVPTVLSSPQPPLLFDYYGFPPEAYRLQWPAPGQPALAARVRELLSAAGFASSEDGERGYDHGTFVPLKLSYPDADIPVVQLSLKQGLDAREHLALGRALAPLRDEGVFLLGSGNTFHNLRAFRDPRSQPAAAEFDRWLQAAVNTAPEQRDLQLAGWASAPFARFCHPREEQLIPLMFCAGAAGQDRGVTTWSGTFGGVAVSAFHFG